MNQRPSIAHGCLVELTGSAPGGAAIPVGDEAPGVVGKRAAPSALLDATSTELRPEPLLAAPGPGGSPIQGAERVNLFMAMVDDALPDTCVCSSISPDSALVKVVQPGRAVASLVWTGTAATGCH